MSLLMRCSTVLAILYASSAARIRIDRLASELVQAHPDFTKCGGKDFEVVKGDTTTGTQRILAGVHQWVTDAASGAWGAFMMREWKPFVACAKALVSVQCATSRSCVQRKMMKINLCGKRGQKAIEETDEGVAQNTEATKLLKIIIMGNFVDVLIGATDTQLIPTMVASFSQDGKLEGLAEFKFKPGSWTERVWEGGKLGLSSAVTRYSLAYAEKGTVLPAKGAGRALIGGWFDQNDYTGDMTLSTMPASAFVRKYYMDNGGHTKCLPNGKFNATTCEEMLTKNENCNCAVELCLTSQCQWYFAAGTCNRAGFQDMVSGYYHGCYTLRGKFNGVCDS